MNRSILSLIFLVLIVRSAGADPIGDLETRCLTGIVSPVADVYYVCADALENSRSLITLECREGIASCRPSGDLVRSNRRFVVRVFTDPDLLPQATMNGAVGTSSGIRQPSPQNSPQFTLHPPTNPKRNTALNETVRSFGPFKPGTATLAVSALKLGDGAPAERVHLDVTFTVQAEYRLAIRLGVGFNWQPFARTVGIESSPNGERYSAVIEGAESGLYKTELVTGVSYFLWPVRDDSLDFSPALGLRLGLLSAGSDVSALTSLTVGGELALGPDFSLGIFAGVARHNTPNSNYQPGRLLSPGVTSIAMHTSATPCVAVVLNFNPGVLKGIGVTQ